MDDSKQFRCCYCNKTHTSNEWNQATAEVCGMSTPIPAPLPLYFKDDDSRFHCPSCRFKVYGDELSEVMSGRAEPGEEIRVGLGRRK